MIKNPPDLKYQINVVTMQKDVANKFKTNGKFDLNMYGNEKQKEGSKNRSIKHVFSSSEDKCDEYRPIFWYLKETKKNI